MQWFQYKSGFVGEAQRVTHYAAPFADDGRLQSLCQQEFDPTQTEEAAEPGAAPQSGQARPNMPCVPCLLLAVAHTNTAENNELNTSGEAVELLLATAAPPHATSGHPEVAHVVHEDGKRRQERAALAVCLRKAQWLLDDAARQVPGDRYSSAQAAELAEILEQLACLVRETNIDPAASET